MAIIDIAPGNHFVGDKETLERFAGGLIEEYSRIDVLVNNALPPMLGLEQASFEDFQKALTIGVTAPFYLSKIFAPYFTKDASIINLSSTRFAQSQPQTESYAAAKGGITSLTHALAMSLAGKGRVNAIASGWIDTHGASQEEADRLQHPVKRVGVPEDIANIILFLAF